MECGHIVYVHVFVIACVGDMSVNSKEIIPGMSLKQHVCKSRRLTRWTLDRRHDNTHRNSVDPVACLLNCLSP